MTTRSRTRPTLEALEDRWCPAVSARIIGSDTLLVRGHASNPGNLITITQNSLGGFTVSDGGVPVFTSGPGTVDNLLILLSFRSDNVEIDLGGFTLDGSVNANLGLFGTNSLSVSNGTVGGSLRYTGGFGRDNLTLGAGVMVNGNLVVHTGFGNDVVTLGTATVVGGRAVFNLGFGSDRLDLNGTIGNDSDLNLLVHAGFGDDRVNINAGAIINGNARIFMDFGNDQLNLSDLAVLNGSLFASGGIGRDDFNGTLPRPNVTLRSFES